MLFYCNFDWKFVEQTPVTFRKVPTLISNVPSSTSTNSLKFAWFLIFLTFENTQQKCRACNKFSEQYDESILLGSHGVSMIAKFVSQVLHCLAPLINNVDV